MGSSVTSVSRPTDSNLGAEQVAHGLTATDQFGRLTFDEDFGWAWTRVVVGGLGHAVGSGVEEDDEVVGLDGGKGSVSGEEVSGFADWAYYVDDDPA